MRNRGKYRDGVVAKVLGFFLAMLLLIVPLTQTLHSHHLDENRSGPTSEKSISLQSEKCLLCHYLNDNMGKQLLLAYPPKIELPNRDCGVLNTIVYARIYKVDLQNFSNKGPPCHWS